MNQLPKVTVVTVVRNGASVVERTLASVIAQDYPDLEFIVVDGGSTDGTLDVIRRHEQSITRWISGPDRGPYDAMNIGADLATGEWIVFMNGGDLFAGPDVVSRTFELIDPTRSDVVYGDGIITAGNKRTVERATVPISLADGNGFSHQSAFVRATLQKRYRFDIEERIAADYDLFLRLWRDGHRFDHVDVVVSEFFLGGLSTISRFDAIRLRHRIYKKHVACSDLRLYLRLALHAVKMAVRAMLPQRTWSSLRRLRGRHVDA